MDKYFPAPPLQPVLPYLIDYWYIAIVALIGAVYGIRKLQEQHSIKNQISGRGTQPASVIIKRTINILTKEDPTPVFTKNEKLAAKTTWLTWPKYTYGLTILWVIHLLTPLTWLVLRYIPFGYLGFTAILALAWLPPRKQVQTVNSLRDRVVKQMFDVASSECKYQKGAELNPWGYIIVHKWEEVYHPRLVEIRFPPAYRSEEPSNRKMFETNFTATVSDKNTWSYEWQSANNRVVAKAVPHIGKTAPYVFPDGKAWNYIPLGVGLGNREVGVDLNTMPHMLVAGVTGSGKLLLLSTAVPTTLSDRNPDGWTTIGEIQVGDQVFDESGNVCTVTGLSEINETPDLYEVEFSDGSIIQADAEHLWWTETRQIRKTQYDAANSTAVRRMLIDPKHLDAIKELLETSSEEQEITLAEFASLAHVHPTTSWLIDVAASVGHVGEAKLVFDYSYAEQVVVQNQKTTVFPAKATWKALSLFDPKLPNWYKHRSECALRAKNSGEDTFVSTQTIGQLLDLRPGRIGAALRQDGLKSSFLSKGIAHFPAQDAWASFANASSTKEVSWLHLREKCAELAENSTDDEIVTGNDIADVLGLNDIQAGVRAANSAGVKGSVQKVPVKLNVPEMTVNREGRWARTYLVKSLASAVLKRVETPAHDHRNNVPTGGVRTTREILETLRTESGHANHSIPVAKALVLPEADLPISPYLLGVWLGDGYSRQGSFCGIDHEIAQILRDSGHKVIEKQLSNHETNGRHDDFRIWKVEGLEKQLKESGLLLPHQDVGTRKRIPAEYLRASIEQRQDLLAGLLDTDGTVAPQGPVQFTNTNPKIAFGVHELALSLGYRATIREGRSVLVKPDGTSKDCGPAWTVSWTCEDSPFKLSRKTKTHQERNTSYNSKRNDYRYIVDIRSIPTEPGRCIMVDSPNRLFLAGDSFIPTHNSVTQRTILLHCLQHPDWRVVGLDLKRVELAMYRGARNVLKIATELDEAVALLGQVMQEMNQRYKKMETEGVNHFNLLQQPPPAVLVMVDETYALLAPENAKSEEGKERDALHAQATVLLGQTARLGRAAGIHLVLATQRPDAKVIPGELRNNLDARVAQGRMDMTPSLMVLDSDAATRIPAVRGRAVLRTGNETTEFQAYFLETELLEETLEMANAIASGAISARDLLPSADDHSEGGEGSEKKTLSSLGGKLPKWLKMPKSFSGWAERRAAVVAENEAAAGYDSEGKFVQSAQGLKPTVEEEQEEFEKDAAEAARLASYKPGDEDLGEPDVPIKNRSTGSSQSADEEYEDEDEYVEDDEIRARRKRAQWGSSEDEEDEENEESEENGGNGENGESSGDTAADTADEDEDDYVDREKYERERAEYRRERRARHVRRLERRVEPRETEAGDYVDEPIEDSEEDEPVESYGENASTVQQSVDDGSQGDEEPTGDDKSERKRRQRSGRPKRVERPQNDSIKTVSVDVGEELEFGSGRLVAEVIRSAAERGEMVAASDLVSALRAELSLLDTEIRSAKEEEESENSSPEMPFGNNGSPISQRAPAPDPDVEMP